MDRGCSSVKRYLLHWIYAQGSEMALSCGLWPPPAGRISPADGLWAFGLPKCCQANDRVVLPPLCVLSGFGISKLFSRPKSAASRRLHHGL
jgi:hypothetical protein